MIYRTHGIYKKKNSPFFLVYLACKLKEYIQGVPGNVPDFGRMFLKLKYTDITKNTYIRS